MRASPSRRARRQARPRRAERLSARHFVMANSPTIAAARSASAIPLSLPSDHIEPRRLVAFLFMVFGMFMAILDIQIVSASLAEIQAGLAASSNEITWVQTAYL